MEKYPLDEVTKLTAAIIKETKPLLDKVDLYVAAEAMSLVHAIIAKKYYDSRNEKLL